MKEERINDFPVWALAYINNGEDDEMSFEDYEMVDEWMEKTGITLVTAIPDASGHCQEYFSNNPVFGDPCQCMNVIGLHEME